MAKEKCYICKNFFDQEDVAIIGNKILCKDCEYKNMPCGCCGENMFNRWIRDIKARICHDCEDRHKILKKDLKYLNNFNS